MQGRALMFFSPPHLFLTLQGELDVLRAQVQRDLDGRLGKMAQASQVRG